MSDVVLVRSATAVEWEEWKTCRLQALQDSPESFGEKYGDAVKKTDAEWKEAMEATANAQDRETLFAVSEDHVVGILYVFVSDAEEKLGGLGGMWVDPEYRKLGIGRQMIETALQWLRKEELRAVTFWNNTASEASTKFYEKLGFVYTGVTKPLESNPNLTIGEMVKEL